MSLAPHEDAPLPANPLDVLEGAVIHQGWPFERSADDELNLTVAGGWADYTLCFNWRDEVETLQLSAVLDIKVPAERRGEIARLVARINEQLWLGHFDLWTDEGLIAFRYGLLMLGGASATPAQCEALIQLVAEACERFFPAFQYVLWSGKSAEEALAGLMLEVAGEA